MKGGRETGKLGERCGHTATLRLSVMTSAQMLGMPGRTKANSIRLEPNVKPGYRLLSHTGTTSRVFTAHMWEAGNSRTTGKWLAAGQSTLAEGES